MILIDILHLFVFGDISIYFMDQQTDRSNFRDCYSEYFESNHSHFK